MANGFITKALLPLTVFLAFNAVSSDTFGQTKPAAKDTENKQEQKVPPAPKAADVKSQAEAYLKEHQPDSLHPYRDQDYQMAVHRAFIKNAERMMDIRTDATRDSANVVETYNQDLKASRTPSQSKIFSGPARTPAELKAIRDQNIQKVLMERDYKLIEHANTFPAALEKVEQGAKDRYDRAKEREARTAERQAEREAAKASGESVNPLNKIKIKDLNPFKKKQ